MNSSSKDLKFEKNATFFVPITRQVHAMGQQFYQAHSSSQKAKQIYLNTLAVCAVDYYLQCLGIETELEAGDSWNIILQTLADSADLVIKGKGKLECRPVLPNSDYCHVSAEVWSERIGYIAVQFNQDLTEANLLGFVPKVTVENFPINQLQSLENLIVLLSEPIEQPLVNLSQWRQNVFAAGWVALDRLLNLQQLQPAFRSRRIEVKPETAWLERARNIPLGQLDAQVALCVALKPTDGSELNIWVDLYPTTGDSYLPSSLELAILDDEGKEAMQAKTQADSQGLQFNFIGYPGDRFSVKIRLGEFSFTQPFVI